MLKRVDRSSPLPAWAQAAQSIRREIETGRFAGGDRLPSEAELAASFHLSRLTVRQALGQLSSEGLIERRQGVGTFVAPRKVAVQHDLSLSSSWRKRFQQEGHESTSRLLEAEVQDAVRPESAGGLTPADRQGKFSFVKRLHLVDGQPIGATESWVPVDIAPDLTELPLDDFSLSATLRNRHGHSAASVHSTLETLLATAADAQLLDTVPDVPLFVVTAISRLKDGSLLDVSRTLWVGGRVRFRFVQENDHPSETE